MEYIPIQLAEDMTAFCTSEEQKKIRQNVRSHRQSILNGTLIAVIILSVLVIVECFGLPLEFWQTVILVLLNIVVMIWMLWGFFRRTRAVKVVKGSYASGRLLYQTAKPTRKSAEVKLPYHYCEIKLPDGTGVRGILCAARTLDTAPGTPMTAVLYGDGTLADLQYSYWNKESFSPLDRWEGM